MKPIPESFPEISLFIARSHSTTAVNQTGSWRFARPIYNEKTAPCSAVCPAGTDIGRVGMLAAGGRLKEAAALILEENPLPAVCGRVCFHPCEAVCNRARMDESMAVHGLERFLGDLALSQGVEAPPTEQRADGRRVAIAGAGPSGLAAAYFLSRLGFSCDIFESAPEPGGVLRWGIPAYRLPAEVLAGEIARITRLGCRIHCDTSVTSSLLSEIRRSHDALFVGCGHGKSIGIGIPGESMITDGLAFLADLRRRPAAAVQGRVAVIGGGNTGVDVARSLRRLGARPILVYRRRRQDMPAFPPEVAMALEEGVRLMELAAPVRVERADPGYRLTLQTMRVFETDDRNRARVCPDTAPEREMMVDGIFSAIGAEAAEPWQQPPRSGAGVLKYSHLQGDTRDFVTLYGGDLTNSVRSVPDAVASGKQAAMVFDTLLEEGAGAVSGRLEASRVGPGPSLSMEIYRGGPRKDRSPRVVGWDDLNPAHFLPAPAGLPGRLDLNHRLSSFSEIETTFSETTAVEEARRCFNCGLCNQCDNCRLFCPEMAVAVDRTRQIDLTYCKGCGICVVECPSSAMDLVEEQR